MRGPHGNSSAKAKDFKKSIGRLFKYCKPFLLPLIIAVVLAVASAVLSVISPNKLKELTDEVSTHMFTGIDLTKILRIAIILMIIYGLSAIFGIIQEMLMATTSQKLSKKLRSDMHKKIALLPLSYIDATPYGDLMSRATNDIDTIGQGLNNSVARLTGAVAMLIASLVMMFATNWIMAFTAIGSSLIGFMLIGLIMSKSQKYFTQQQKCLGELNGYIEEIFTSHDIVKVYNATENKRKGFDKINKKLHSSVWKSQFLAGMMPNFMFFVGNFSHVAICVVGALLVTNGKISIGTIVAFIMYSRLFSNPLTQIAQAMSSLQSTAAASERVFDLLSEKEIVKDENVVEIDPKNIEGNVEFNHIKFGYTADKIIINDFSAKVKKGQKVAIVGHTGAGKTTLVNLLMRFYELDGGSIEIDGVNIKNIDKNVLHNIFGMVLQDTWLFEGSVRENLVFNRADVSDEMLDKVCEACGLTHFINTLSKGYDTVLDDNTAISAGQKQLMTIARAMLQNCPMLILDEATSSIDTRTEVLIQKAMDKLTENRTSFVIAHRLSTIKNADLIIVMDNGDIVEQGTHAQLLSKNGMYANLYNSQFEK